MSSNIDVKTVEGFGDEWSRFDQTGASEADLDHWFDAYFRIFPWDELPHDAVGFDLGCGSGRWASRVALRVGRLHCIDPSEKALKVAQRNLVSVLNCELHLASVDSIPLADGSMDFGYSLGVLHHVPDTSEGIRSCVQKLKPGAPLLLYLYYAFDNRPFWYRIVWKASDFLRRRISRTPHPVRYAVSQWIALSVYYPVARTALILEKLGFSVQNMPLAAYRGRSFYMMRTDALDRFGTKLEQRFTIEYIHSMMEHAGLERIKFSDHEPYWCAVGHRKVL